MQRREKPTLPSQLIASLYAYRAMPPGIRARCQLQRPAIDAIVNWNGGIRSTRDDPISLSKRNALALLRLKRDTYVRFPGYREPGGFCALFNLTYPEQDKARGHALSRWQRRYLRSAAPTDQTCPRIKLAHNGE